MQLPPHLKKKSPPPEMESLVRHCAQSSVFGTLLFIFYVNDFYRASDLLFYLPMIRTVLKGNAAYLKKKYIIDENDALSEYNKIPLGHNRTNGAVYSKIYFKVEICSAH